MTKRSADSHASRVTETTGPQTRDAVPAHTRTEQTHQLIVERELAEAALRDSEARLRAVVEGMPVLLYALGERGLVAAWNSECERVTGYRADEIVGNPAAMELLYPDPAYREEMTAAWRSRGHDYRGWVWNLTCKDGTVRRIEWSNVSDRLPIPGWVIWGVGVDVTERVQLEEQLRQSHKVQAIGQLAAGVAHDFNNLLTVINGHSAILGEALAGRDPILEDSATAIRDAGARGAMLTRQLLLFSRKAVVAPVLLDLNGVVQDTSKILGRLIGEDITLTTALGPGLRSARVDLGQAEQLLMNLCLNARDAMPEGGLLTIETSNDSFDEEYCRTHTGVRSGEFVRLTIRDTGIGMTPEVRAHLFEPFFTTKAPGQGTGLGLATVHGIVQQAGGFITLETGVGSGTSFNVFLPAVADPASARTPDTTAEPALAGTEVVLLVEDEAGVRDIARRTLERRGYVVLEATSGPEAVRLEAAHDGPIALLVTDVVMPEMNGRQLARILCARRSDMEVLFMSGYDDDVIVRRGVRDSTESFLQKPFTPTALARKVRDVLDRRH